MAEIIWRFELDQSRVHRDILPSCDPNIYIYCHYFRYFTIKIYKKIQKKDEAPQKWGHGLGAWLQVHRVFFSICGDTWLAGPKCPASSATLSRRAILLLLQFLRKAPQSGFGLGAEAPGAPMPFSVCGSAWLIVPRHSTVWCDALPARDSPSLLRRDGVRRGAPQVVPGQWQWPHLCTGTPLRMRR